MGGARGFTTTNDLVRWLLEQRYLGLTDSGATLGVVEPVEVEAGILMTLKKGRWRVRMVDRANGAVLLEGVGATLDQALRSCRALVLTRLQNGIVGRPGP